MKSDRVAGGERARLVKAADCHLLHHSRVFSMSTQGLMIV
jgi:hypothetical protein